MPNPIIVFVCEHGAAKSVVAAAYFNKLARQANLGFHAIARGTHPDQELAPSAITGLHQDGLTPSEPVPRNLSLADVEAAQRTITFCELPDEFHQKGSIEQWDGIPPVSEDYEQARDAILERINKLMNELA
jgi:protein-tyrosine-phosphatase